MSATTSTKLSRQTLLTIHCALDCLLINRPDMAARIEETHQAIQTFATTANRIPHKDYGIVGNALTVYAKQSDRASDSVEAAEKELDKKTLSIVI